MLFLHAERFITLLEAAHGKVLKGVDIVAKVDAAFLTRAKGASRYEAVPSDLREGGVARLRIHQQFPVERETYKFN